MPQTPIPTTTVDPDATDEVAPRPALNVNDEASAKAWLQTLFSNLVKLEIKTEKIDDDDAAKVIHTKIDLLQGDITTRIHKDFVEGVDIYEFHKEQVKKAEEIISQNVKTVKTMAESLFELFF